MKAAVLFKPNEPLQVVECELDPPKAGEVRVKMKAAGVCQSDWHIMNGDWPSPMPVALPLASRAMVTPLVAALYSRPSA